MKPWAGSKSTHRGDHDDGTGAPLDQMRRHCLDRPEHATHDRVDDHGVELLGDFPRGRTEIPNPGIGDRAVNATERLEAQRDGGVECALIADIANDGNRPPTPFLDQLLRLDEIVFGSQRISDAVDLAAHVQQHDVGALARGSHRMGSALTPRCTGDEDDLVIQCPHDRFPLLRRTVGSRLS